MFTKHSPRHGVYAALELEKLPKRRQKLRWIVLLCVMLGIILTAALYLRRLSCEIAVSDAADAVTMAINDSVKCVMEHCNYSYSDYVTLEKDASGSIAAISANTTRINALSTEILEEIVSRANNQILMVRIPFGNLLGSNLLLGRGPEIPVQIIMLTSSNVHFNNQLVSTAINQSRHEITLCAEVDIDILIPWETVSTTVNSEILIADTVIVGRVPETYVSITEEQNGSKGSKTEN